MSASKDGPNLRPYWNPPPPPPANISAPEIISTSAGTHGLGLKNGSAASYASSARNIFSDIDYSDLLSDSSPSAVDTAKEFLSGAVTDYLSVFISQPFEVAKLVLQVKCQETAEEEARLSPINLRNRGYRNDQYLSDDSDHDDEAAYFTSAAPQAHSYSPVRSRRRGNSLGSDYDSRTPSPRPKPSSKTHQLVLKKSDSIMDVVAQEWSIEGASGVWKGSNTTFFYGLAWTMVESFVGGLTAGALDVPYLGLVGGKGYINVAESSSPLGSFGVAVFSALATSLILAPLDMIRTKLILTPTTNPKRGIISNINTLPSLTCPSTLLIPTLLHSLVSPIFSYCTPVFLRTQLSLDPLTAPTSYSLFAFLSQTVEIFVRLPFETVLRRAQAAVLMSELHTKGLNMRTIVDVGPYKGVLGTMWSIAREEGQSDGGLEATKGAVKAVKRTQKVRKGQGLEGLWRGWRVNVWGLVGMYGARAMNGMGSSEGEF